MPSLLEDKHYMSIAALGTFTIDVTPIDNSGLYHVDIGSEKRKDVVSMQTNPGETVDQFGMRIKSMLRALLNGEPKVLPQEKLDAQPVDSRLPEQPAPHKKGHKELQGAGH
jgi:hypothetical protein